MPEPSRAGTRANLTGARELLKIKRKKSWRSAIQMTPKIIRLFHFHPTVAVLYLHYWTREAVINLAPRLSSRRFDNVARKNAKMTESRTRWNVSEIRQSGERERDHCTAAAAALRYFELQQTSNYTRMPVVSRLVIELLLRQPARARARIYIYFFSTVAYFVNSASWMELIAG